jgi:hypothetical protein
MSGIAARGLVLVTLAAMALAACGGTPVPATTAAPLPREAAPVSIAEIVTGLDRDGDDALTMVEVERAAAAPAPKPATVRLLDRDGDGRLAPAELAAAGERLLLLDADADGRVTTAELVAGSAAGEDGTVPFGF